MGFLSSFFSSLFGGKQRPGGGRAARRMLRHGTEEELLQYARQLAEDNQLDSALEVLRQAQDLHPGSEAIAELAESVESSALHAQIGAMQAALDEHGSPEILTRLAELYRRLSDFPMAMKYGREAIELDPASAVGYRMVGRLYLEQFRVAQQSVQGMNALRYLSKAHKLDPRDSRTLLNLAEIFVILRAPEAARKFLAPVLQAFPNEPKVVRLEERVRELPSEGSSHIQDLFLRHEQRISGEQLASGSVDLPGHFAGELGNFAEAVPGTLGIYLVDGDRNLVSHHAASGWDNEELAETTGLLGDTARQNSQRMGIGKFSRLVVNSADHLMVVDCLRDDLTAFYIGESSVKQEDAEAAVRKIGKLVGVKVTEEVAQ